MLAQLADPMHAIRPDLLGYDILDRDENTERFAYTLECNFALNYERAGLTDADVLEALRAAYFQIHRGQDYPTENPFARFFVRTLRESVKPRFDPLLPSETQEGILLRLMWSVKNISGGAFGPRGYLDYVRNEVVDDPPEETHVVESPEGARFLVQILD